MEFDDYQKAALQSEQKKGDEGLIIALLGLAGEVGELSSAYKKYLRDGNAHMLYEASIKEELGDILWYLANVTNKFNFSLNDVAKANLEKTKSRWLSGTTVQSPDELSITFYDKDQPIEEQLPRRFVATVVNNVENATNVARTYIDDSQVGDDLTDNAYLNDGYRFHDVFHLAYVAVLGWSPVIRKNFNRKRKSNPSIDEVEDGGRAAAIEEGISALIFAYAKEHNWLKNVTSVDDSLLKIIMGMSAHLEVRNKTTAEWEKAILKGYDVWRQIVASNGGSVEIDMNMCDIKIVTT
jgi:NTP pyrophosphatase (non-canonical NTP hydrolase)